jgi:hypothetical protein
MAPSLTIQRVLIKSGVALVLVLLALAYSSIAPAQRDNSVSSTRLRTRSLLQDDDLPDCAELEEVPMEERCEFSQHCDIDGLINYFEVSDATATISNDSHQ